NVHYRPFKNIHTDASTVKSAGSAGISAGSAGISGGWALRAVEEFFQPGYKRCAQFTNTSPGTTLVGCAATPVQIHLGQKAFGACLRSGADPLSVATTTECHVNHSWTGCVFQLSAQFRTAPAVASRRR